MSNTKYNADQTNQTWWIEQYDYKYTVLMVKKGENKNEYNFDLM